MAETGAMIPDPARAGNRAPCRAGSSLAGGSSAGAWRGPFSRLALEIGRPDRMLRTRPVTQL
jgi:hypothetical protein